MKKLPATKMIVLALFLSKSIPAAAGSWPCEVMFIYADKNPNECFKSNSMYDLRNNGKVLETQSHDISGTVMRLLDEQYEKDSSADLPKRYDAEVLIDCHHWNGSITTYTIGLDGGLHRPADQKSAPMTPELKKIFTMDGAFESRIKALKKK